MDRNIGGLKLLAMDTATSSMSVGLLEGGKVLKEIHSFAERNHSIYLLPCVREALDELGWSPGELQGVVTGLGPGSYTGVRIGVTVAKTMAWALGLPVVGVSSLEAMAAGGWADCVKSWNFDLVGKIWIIPMMSARRGQVFTALFELRLDAGQALGEMAPVAEEGWSRLKEDGIRLMEPWADQLLELLRQSAEPPSVVLFTGETADFAEITDRFAQEAEGLAGGGVVRTVALPHGIRAEYIGYLGALRLARGDSDDIHGLLPNYTQLPEAEVKLMSKKKST